MAKAISGSGSIKQRTTGKLKGKWRVRWAYKDPATGLPVQVDRTFDKQKGDGGAVEFLDALKTRVRLGDNVEATKSKKALSVGGWFDWLVENDWETTVAPTTVAARKGRFNNYVRKRFGDVPLALVDSLTVKKFYDALAAEGASSATIAEVKAVLVRMYNQAIRPYGRIPAHYANPFAIPMRGRSRREAIALSPDESLAAVFHTNLDTKQRAMLATLLFAGLRLGEQMELTRGQIDFDKHLIYVDRATKIDAKGRQTVGLPKGGKKRTVVMCRTLANILADHVQGMEPDTLLWPSAFENQARMRKLVYATWRQIRKTSDLPKTMTPRDCRLSHNNWIEKLMPTVSRTQRFEHMGHSGEGVNEINYTRPLTPSQKVLRDELDRVLAVKP